ncbi:MAG: methyltransferase domain-containing protein [Pyrinomonadaceae bacterium]
MAEQKLGWFHTEGRLGDRTIEQQLMGLDMLMERVPGKSVLDVGCAEGLIAIEMAKRGATAVHGVEIVPGHVEVGNELRGDLPVLLEVGDANTYTPVRQYDIVIMLALLHKLEEPSRACFRFAAAARELVVLRHPPSAAPNIVDVRSGLVKQKIPKAMRKSGFKLIREAYDGPLDEYVAYWERA